MTRKRDNENDGVRAITYCEILLVLLTLVCKFWLISLKLWRNRLLLYNDL